MNRLYFLLIFIFGFVAFSTAEQTQPSTPASDEAAIRQVITDYIESWYEGNHEKMEKCLHPQFVKRRGLDQKKLDHIDTEEMVRLTKGKAGMGTPKDKQQKEITILEIYGSMTSAKLVSVVFVDYLHLVKVEGRWLIVNSVWNFK